MFETIDEIMEETNLTEDISSLKKTALSLGYCSVENEATVCGRKYALYKKSAEFCFPTQTFLEESAYYLLLSEEDQKAFLCFNSSLSIRLVEKIKYNRDDRDFRAFLNKVFDFSTDVSGIMAFCGFDYVGEFGPCPFTTKISKSSEIEDDEWFERAVVCYQTVVELILNDYVNKTF